MLVVKTSTFFALFSCTIYASLLNSRTFGFGFDVISNYSTNRRIHDGLFDWLGAYASKLTIGGTYFGVFVVSFLLFYSVYNLINSLSPYSSYIIKILSTIFFSFSWPVITLSLNALRQGLAQSLFYFIISLFLDASLKKTSFNHKFNFIYLFCPLALFSSHKSGLIFLSFLFWPFVMHLLNKRLAPSNNSILLNTMLSVTFSLIPFLYLAFLLPDNYSSRITGFDASIPLAILLFIISVLPFRNKLFFKNFGPISILPLSFALSGFSYLYLGLNYQYERLCLSFLIPTVLFTISSARLTNSFASLLVLLSSFIFFLATFFLPFTHCSHEYNEIHL